MSRRERTDLLSVSASEGKLEAVGRKDWVLRADRSDQARDRIMSTASEFVSRNGFEAFTIDALAAELNCSPATIYRHAGGKAEILERLIFAFSQRIIGSIRQAIVGMEGTERVATAIIVALDLMRGEVLGKLMMSGHGPDRDAGTVTASPFVAKMAEEMIGRSDPLAAQWLIRITFALWYWPVKDKHTEHELVKRFAATSLTQGFAD